MNYKPVNLAARWSLALLLPLLLACGGIAVEPAAKVEVQLLDFEQLQKLLAGHKGKVLVVDCWSTSCEPCKKEFPKLVALHKKYGPEQVACVSLSFDYDGIGKPEAALPRVQAFLAAQNATFDNVVSKLVDTDLYKKLDVNSVPTVLVYDRQGKLREQFEQEPVYGKVPAAVEKLLAEK